MQIVSADGLQGGCGRVAAAVVLVQPALRHAQRKHIKAGLQLL
jgi:hypothetical protein